MIPRDRLVNGSDIQTLRELLGVTDLDLFWLLGSLVPSWRTTGPEAQEPLNQPSLAVLVRYLSKYPDNAYLPQLPELEDVYPFVLNAYNGELPARRLGPIWGVSGWSGNQWVNGHKPSQVVRRLFKLYLDAVEQEGEEEGFRRFVEVVDDEARARGFKGGLEEVQNRGSWGVRKEKVGK
jgi:hypothetical protein